MVLIIAFILPEQWKSTVQLWDPLCLLDEGLKCSGMSSWNMSQVCHEGNWVGMLVSVVVLLVCAKLS